MAAKWLGGPGLWPGAVGIGTMEIEQQTGEVKPTIWRWQERFMVMWRGHSASLMTPASMDVATGGKQVEAAHRVLLNTMPKSGSVFLLRTLSEGLRIPSMYLGNMYSLVDQISLEKMRVFAAGSFVSQNHLAPSLENLQILDHFGCRLVLHIRDPRRALLSLVHHLDRICGNDHSEGLLMFAPRTPVSYFSWDFGRKLDWQIDNYLPLLIEWLGRWVAVHDDGRLPVLLTTYDELSGDAGSLCGRICDFYGIPEERFRFVHIPKTIDNHFRMADNNEWYRACSAEQIERANAMLPPELARRFNWPL